MAAQELFTTGLFNDANLQGYYRLEDVNDASANARNLTNTGSVAFNAAKFNNGADLGTSNSTKYLRTTNTLGIDGGAMSFTGWVKITTAPSSNSYCLISQSNNTSKTAFFLYYQDSAGTKSITAQRLSTGVAADNTPNFNVDLGTSTFAHLAVTYDGTTLRIYLNGALAQSVASSGNGVNAITSGFNIGSRSDNNGDLASAIIDDVGVFNRALTLTEIKMLYQGGIAFNAAANSADIAAASSFSGNASWYGTNRALCIDVSMLGPGVTVTAMTYGGAACTFIGSKSTVTSLGSVECWRITAADAGAPAAGANTLSVTLSGSIEFTVEWVSYTGVHQTSPTEGFNSAQATNSGSATDASVAITTVADNDWVHAAVVANDTSITAGNTSRNNTAGTIGSGANEDNNTAKTPAGSVTMSYSGMGITTTWAIAGYALRDINAASLATAALGTIRSLMGVGI